MTTQNIFTQQNNRPKYIKTKRYIRMPPTITSKVCATTNVKKTSSQHKKASSVRTINNTGIYNEAPAAGSSKPRLVYTSEYQYEVLEEKVDLDH